MTTSYGAFLCPEDELDSITEDLDLYGEIEYEVLEDFDEKDWIDQVQIWLEYKDPTNKPIKVISADLDEVRDGIKENFKN